MLLVIVSFFLISLTAITGVYAIEENDTIVTISKDEADLSGDGQNESIYLKGVPYQEGQSEEDYLKEIYIEIAASNGKTYTIPLDSGSKATLAVVDLNHDGLKELFASVLMGDAEESVTGYLYSFKNFSRSELTVPEPLEMDAKFSNGYKAEMRLLQTGKTYVFDLKSRKKYYKKLGFYYKGKLNEPTELSVNTFNSLKSVQLKNGRMGIKGVQKVTGVANADTIAYVESNWYLNRGHWELFNAKVKKGDS